MCEQKPLVSYFAPCKGAQVQSRILDFTPWIPIHCTRFQSLSVEPGLPAVNRIPDPLSCIPDFKAQVSGFHKKNFSKFQIPQAKKFPCIRNLLHEVSYPILIPRLRKGYLSE